MRDIPADLRLGDTLCTPNKGRGTVEGGSLRKTLGALLSASLWCAALPAQKPQQRLNAYNLSLVHGILADAYREVKKNYYDPGYHKLDLESRYHTYDGYLDRAPTMSEAFHVIAAFLAEFHDSHLFFEPPERGTKYDSGYRMQMVGDRCFVTRVRPHSDAESKVHPGDEIVSLDGFAVNRTDIEDAQYYFHLLTPLTAEGLEVRSPEGEMRRVLVQEVQVPTKRTVDLSQPENDDYWNLVRRGENEAHLKRERLATVGDTTVWKMAEFSDDSDAHQTALWAVRKHNNLILDLRGNPGGYTDALKEIVGAFFDHDVKIADRVSRKPDNEPGRAARA
jgi:C-terminal processing protease CtpA/Prc